MNRTLRIVIAIAAMAVYLLALRYVAPSDKPYFILGIGVVGYVAWLLGALPALASALVLIPLTHLIYEQFTVSTSYMTFAYSPAYTGMLVIAAVTLGRLRNERFSLACKKAELDRMNIRLQEVLSKVQELGGVHNLCGECKAIQDDAGNWQAVDRYLKEQTKMEFSHCMCPDCAKRFMKQAKSMPDQTA